MTLETHIFSIIGGGLVDAAGGSVILIGSVFLIGTAILMKKLEMGLSSGIVITMVVLGFLANYADSRQFLITQIGGDIPFFKMLYIIIIVGAAITWAVFLRRR